MSVNLDENLRHFPPDKKKRSWRGCGCIVGILGLIGAIFGLIFGATMIASYQFSAPVPGDAANFDPVAAYADVKAYAGDHVQLLEIEARFVRRDGTLDLTAEYHPDVTYMFFRAAQAPENTAPLGVPGSAAASDNESFYEQIEVKLWRPMQMFSRTQNNNTTSYMHLGMERGVRTARPGVPGESLSAPQCSFERLWTSAMEYGAPATAVATITYDIDGYHFEIRETDFEFEFDTDCRLK